MRYILMLVTLFLSFSLIEAHADPRSRKVDLHKRTTLIAYIVPDMGTRFTFPFVLDETDSYIPFTLTPTNEIFHNDRQPKRNYFVITAPKAGTGKYYGNLFVTVAGFEITIELRTTNDLSKADSDIVFNLTADDREDLIQKGIAQRTKALEAEYTKKMDAIEADTDQKAVARIARLALTKPSHKGIKEENTLKLPNGDKLILYVDETVNYDPYTIILFNLTVDSATKGVSIMDAKLFATDPDTKQSRPVVIGKDIPSRVQPDGRIQGAVTVLNGNLYPKDLLKLQILTDKGLVEAQW